MKKCYFCGLFHPDDEICPKVKAIEYHPDGTVKRIEFKDVHLELPGDANVLTFPKLPEES